MDNQSPDLSGIVDTGLYIPLALVGGVMLGGLAMHLFHRESERSALEEAGKFWNMRRSDVSPHEMSYRNGYVDSAIHIWDKLGEPGGVDSSIPVPRDWARSVAVDNDIAMLRAARI